MLDKINTHNNEQLTEHAESINLIDEKAMGLQKVYIHRNRPD